MKSEMGFDKIFDDIFSSAEIGYKKPDKKFYQFILKKLKKEQNISPKNLLFFDDTRKHVDEAKKLKIDAHVYTNFKDLKKRIKSY